MKKTFLNLIIIFNTLFLLLFFNLSFVSAQTPPPPPDTTGCGSASSSAESGFSVNSTLSCYLNDIYKWSIGVAAGLAVIMLLYAGYSYATSGGNADTINQAKEIIVGAIAGLVLLILAALILRALGIGS